MNLLEEPKQTGQICPKCSKGILELKRGKYGRFIGCSGWPNCFYSTCEGVNLQELASQLLKAKNKRKKIRRGKKKKNIWKKYKQFKKNKHDKHIFNQ